MEYLQEASTIEESTQEVVRPPLEFDESVPRYWANQNPVITAFFNAVSTVIPEGERFFIVSVRCYQGKLNDAELDQDIDRFICQEASHSRAHRALNKWLDSIGFPSRQSESKFRNWIVGFRMRASAESNLVRTVAIEHLSTVLTRGFLGDKKNYRNFHPAPSDLFRWHSIEENDHKSVAFDVYQRVNGNYFRRVIELISITLYLFCKINSIIFRFLSRDRQLYNLSAWSKALWFFWGCPGWFRKAVPSYMKYFSPNFHPSQVELVDFAMINSFNNEIEQGSKQI